MLSTIQKKKKYSAHYQRMVNANMNFPIIIWKEKNLVVDGNHRLGNAYLNNDKTIKAFVFDNKLMKKFRIGKFNNRKEYSNIINNIKINHLIILFYKRFLNW